MSILQTALDILTRKPGAYSALDPGSLYGYITSPEYKEAQKKLSNKTATTKDIETLSRPVLGFVGDVKVGKFGVVKRAGDANFLSKDGQLVGGARSVDHYSQIGGKTDVGKYLKETGHIRMDSSNNYLYLDMSGKPTSEQFSKIGEIMKGKKLIVDFRNGVGGFINPSSDIKNIGELKTFVGKALKLLNQGELHGL